MPSNKEITSQIAYVSKEDEENYLIVLEIDNEIEELTNYRKISFNLIWWSKTGLKVPNQALTQENGLYYVTRNKAGVQSKILVKVKRQTDKYSIIESYKNEELQELGYNAQEIKNYKKISNYDEIMINN